MHPVDPKTFRGESQASVFREDINVKMYGPWLVGASDCDETPAEILAVWSARFIEVFNEFELRDMTRDP